MNSGQLSMVSVQTVVPLAAQEQTGSVAVAGEGEQQLDGNFAGMLRGFQHLAKTESFQDSEQAESGQSRNGIDPKVAVAGTEPQNVDLLALLQVQHGDASVLDSSVSPDNTETGDLQAKAETNGCEPADIASLMAIAGYLQPGRVSGINGGAPIAADSQPNVATEIGKPAVESAASIISADRIQNVATGAESSAAGSAAQTVTLLEPEAMARGEKTAVKHVEISKNADVIRIAAEQVKPSPQPAVATTTSASELPSSQSDRMSDANRVMTRPLDGLQNVSAISHESASAVDRAATTSPSAGPDSASLILQSELQYSRPAGSVLPSDRAVVLSQDVAAVDKQQVGGDKLRVSAERNDVKGMDTVSLTEVPDSKSSVDSDMSPEGDGNQDQADGALGSKILEQQVFGQTRSEHLKVAEFSVKPLQSEAARQDVSEQVLPQVREHLARHEVKPGNQQITLTLSPDNLGELKMNLNLQGNKLSVEILAENRSVRDVIVQHTEALKESLARQNITMQSFDVTTGGKGSGNQGQNQNAWRELAQQQQQQQSWASPRGYITAQADIPSGRAAHPKLQGQSMLDIHY